MKGCCVPTGKADKGETLKTKGGRTEKVTQHLVIKVRTMWYCVTHLTRVKADARATATEQEKQSNYLNTYQTV